MLTAKRKLYKHYQIAFSEISGLKLITEPKYCQSNYWLQTLLLDVDQADQRDEILKMTNNLGFMTRPAWQLMSESKPFSHCPKMDLICSELLVRRLINIPSSSNLINSI